MSNFTGSIHRSVTSFFILAITLPLFQQCKQEKVSPCNPSTTQTFNLAADQSNLIPYSGSDTLKFFNSTGDTAAVTGKGSLIDYEVVESGKSNPACPPDIQKYQFKLVSYKGPWNFNPLEFKVTCLSNNLIIYFKNISFTIGTDKLRTEKYVDTVILEGKTYSAFKMYSFSYDDFNDPENEKNFIYYSHQQGVLKIELRDGTVWRRKF